MAELSRALVPYSRGAGIDARWLVVEGAPGFFEVTKRIHNMLHGHRGDGGPLGPRERALYERTLADNAQSLCSRLGARDVVVLHDPQTAGLLPLLAGAGTTLIWRCHVGTDTCSPLAQAAWEFLMRYLRRADRIVVSPGALLPAALAGVPVDRIAPAIDPCATKSMPMPDATARAILCRAGIGRADHASAPAFQCRDGARVRVRRRAAVWQVDAGLRLGAAPLIASLGRWDRLKDPLGVLEGIAFHVPARLDAHLVLAGPEVQAVTDDPEGAEVLADLVRAWEALPRPARRRVTLAVLPMDDLEENAVIVNALQRQATVIVKKSLQEGFGLGITEALWKRRPVVATRVGGVPSQVEHGVTGLLVDDPTDARAFGRAVGDLLEHPELAAGLGRNGQLVVRRRLLSSRHLTEWADLLTGLSRPAVARERGPCAA